MDRREALKRAALLSGFAMSAPLASALLSGCEVEPAGADFVPSFLSEEEYLSLRNMVDLMLPRTDTPGGLDLEVPQFMESYLAVIYEEEDRLHFKTGLQEFNEGAQNEYGKPFGELSESEQYDFMNQVRSVAVKAFDQPTTPDPMPFFPDFMNLALFIYFSSEKVATELLAYDPVPGVYQGCIPFEEVGKTWAL